MSDDITYTPDYDLLKKYFINGPNYNIHTFTWLKNSFFEGTKSIDHSTAEKLKKLAEEYTKGKHLYELYFLSAFIHQEEVIDMLFNPTDKNHKLMVEKFALHDFVAEMKSNSKQIEKIILIDHRGKQFSISLNRVLIGSISETIKKFLNDDPDLSLRIYDVSELDPGKKPSRVIDENRELNFPGRGNRRDAGRSLSKYKRELLKALSNFFVSEEIIEPKHVRIFLAKLLFICELPERNRDGIVKDPFALKGDELKNLLNQIRYYLKG